MAKIPAYEKVFEQLKKEIVDGDISVGEFLPPEGMLEKRFDVSRTTIRRATELLSREKFVEIKQGRGTKVIDHKTQQTLNRVTSISETLMKKGYVVESKSMHIDTIQATVNQARELGIEQGDELVRIQRVQTADGRPVAIMRNYLLPYMVPGVEDYNDKFTSLYKFLETRYGINIDSAKNGISATIASFNEAEMLDIKIGAPLLRIARTCYMGEKPVCLDRIRIVGDVYEFEMIMDGKYSHKNED
jgi:DNA-binding GntR family transcriptional regulator